MYNEELEKLIELALADGILTEKEKTVLYKKAQAFGIDKAEFEMVLEGKLHIKKQEGAGKRESVLVCPRCGDTIPPLSFVCPSCSFILNSNSQQVQDNSLDELIQNIEHCLVEIKALPSQNIRTLFDRVIRNKENKYGRLKGEIEKHSRTAKTLYGENKKVLLLINELERELVKAEKIQINSFWTSIVIFVLGISVLLIGIIFFIRLNKENTFTDQGLQKKVENALVRNDFEKAKEYSSRIEDFRTRTIKFGHIQSAEILLNINKNKLDTAIALYNVCNYVGKNFSRDRIIEKLIEVRRMTEAESFFSEYYVDHQNEPVVWMPLFMKIYYGYISQKNIIGAKTFVIKYALETDRAEYLKKISESLKQ